MPHQFQPGLAESPVHDGCPRCKRVWTRAFPDQPAFEGAGEADMRRKLSQPWRTLSTAPVQAELPL